MTLRARRCTYCGGCRVQETMISRSDAGGDEHWFHPTCWREFCAWLAGPVLDYGRGYGPIVAVSAGREK